MFARIIGTITIAVLLGGAAQAKAVDQMAVLKEAKAFVLKEAKQTTVYANAVKYYCPDSKCRAILRKQLVNELRKTYSGLEASLRKIHATAVPNGYARKERIDPAKIILTPTAARANAWQQLWVNVYHNDVLHTHEKNLCKGDRKDQCEKLYRLALTGSLQVAYATLGEDFAEMRGNRSQSLVWHDNWNAFNQRSTDRSIALFHFNPNRGANRETDHINSK